MTRAAPRRKAIVFDPYAHVVGGAQRVDALLAAEMPALGWTVELLTTADGPLPQLVRGRGAPVGVVAVPPALARYGRTTTGWHRARAAAALPVYWLRLRREVRERAAVVVHVVDHRGMLLAGVPARAGGAAVVWHLHAVDRHRLIDRIGTLVSEAILVPSRSAVDRRLGHLPSDRVRVVGNPLLEPGPPDVPPRPAGTTVLMLARHHPDKGADVLVRAWPAVLARHPDARLRIVGPTQAGSEQVPHDLRRLAAALGVLDTVSVDAQARPAGEELGAARVYVQPSRERTESFGLAVLEAMAAGVPVVATDVSGLADLVDDRRTGLLVPPEDPEALSRAIVELLGDDALGDALRAAAHARATGPDHQPATYLLRIAAAWDAATARRSTTLPAP